MLTELAIRDRFVKCLGEVSEPQSTIAQRIGTSSPYLTKIKTADNTSIPASVIANFCKEYDYSATYILQGKGSPKAKSAEQEKKDLYYLRIIDNLTKELGAKKRK